MSGPFSHSLSLTHVPSGPRSPTDSRAAPLTIWLNGGPGSPSTIGALQENGPCLVNPDSNSTRHNPWSWNGASQMLYIDQPVQTGFSYDSLFNGTCNQAVPLDSNPITLFPRGTEPTEPGDGNATFYYGTFSSQNASYTPNSTYSAAPAFWAVTQAWWSLFPRQLPSSVHLWAESYGGHYGPVFARYFQTQNDKIRKGEIKGRVVEVETLGLVNAW
jgi:carboxypeptidase C (cathepsin A)